MPAVKITDMTTGKVTYPKGVPVPVADRKPMLTAEERRQRNIQRGKEIRNFGFSLILLLVTLPIAILGVAGIIAALFS